MLFFMPTKFELNSIDGYKQSKKNSIIELLKFLTKSRFILKAKRNS